MCLVSEERVCLGVGSGLVSISKLATYEERWATRDRGEES